MRFTESQHISPSRDNFDTQEVADDAGPGIEPPINQVVQVSKMEEIEEHIGDVREFPKNHLSEFLKPSSIAAADKF